LDKKFYNQLTEFMELDDINVAEPMSNHTTFKIGGPADYFITPRTVEHLQEAVRLCQKENIPYYIMGNGSNLLVGDKGYRGAIIQVSKKFNQIQFEENGHVTAGAGIMLSKLAMEIAEHQLTGFEYEAGIPGTLGGAVAMNAGAYGGEIKDYIVSATVLEKEGNLLTLQKEELALGYRTSIIQKEDYVVVSATFAFQHGNKDEILSKIIDFNSRRKEKQPLEFPSAGSTFKRPEGHFAGKLIMDAGLAGYKVGDIMVSEKHCGFVINLGSGTAHQVLTIIEDIQRIVYEKSGVRLEPEVRLLGEF
jgi:UDP-N-acetylmuramate dehydrogenase